jgi:DNA-binding NtrC family response regulator
MQAGLLRTIEEGEFMRVDGTRPIAANVRFIAASDQDIKGLMTAGKFMKELYYKLNIADIFIPPLRERKEAVGPLCTYFLQKYVSARKINGFTDETMDILTNYSFPGNIRELENIIERAVILEKGPLITAESLPRSIKMFQIETFSPEGIKTIDEITRDYTEKVLGLVDGDKKKAAKLLGISEIDLWRILKE